MNHKIFQKVLIAVIAVCLVLTLTHLLYAVLAYRNSSIIQLILREWW